MTALRIGDEPLEPAALAAAARDATLQVSVSDAARERIAAAAEAADAIAATRPVYGRTTGVGAQRMVTLAEGDEEHSLRLLRSHAGGLGEPLLTSATSASVSSARCPPPPFAICVRRATIVPRTTSSGSGSPSPPACDRSSRRECSASPSASVSERCAPTPVVRP